MLHQTTALEFLEFRLKELEAFARWLWGAHFNSVLAGESGVSAYSSRKALRRGGRSVGVPIRTIQKLEDALRARGFVSALDFSGVQRISLSRYGQLERVPTAASKRPRAACFLIPARKSVPAGLAIFDVFHSG